MANLKEIAQQNLLDLIEENQSIIKSVEEDRIIYFSLEELGRLKMLVAEQASLLKSEADG
jgi:hypothetical protein